MGRNDHYWYNREANAVKALNHTNEMGKEFPDEIKACIKNSLIYSPDSIFTVNKSTNKSEVIFDNVDSVSALKYREGKTAVLNFASYKNPGGGFMGGSSAQEESLCHASFLYNVLKEFQDYYDRNNEMKNKGLYTNRAIYSPNVKFLFDNQWVDVDVITCASPNWSVGMRYKIATPEENSFALRSRIEFIKEILEENNVNTFISGAYGCGVFAQNPMEVASLFKEIFDTTTINRIVYAVPGNDINEKTFKEVFCD